jgi:ATP-dependent protease Clp ATPase subunit
MYELPSRGEVSRCVIDEDVVAGRITPTLEEGERRRTA